MSTNYYAEIEATGDETTPLIRMHLGKTSNNSTSVDGNLFPSFKSMIEFLKFNEATITSCTGIEYNVEEFAKMFYDADTASRRFQYNWVINNSEDKSRTWIDDEGFTMSKGSWS